VGGGFTLGLAYPAIDWAGTAWIALVPVFYVAVTAPPRTAFGWGWLAGFAFFLPLLRWLNFTFRTYSDIPWPLTWAPTMALAGYCALYFGLVAAAMALIARRRGAGWACLAAPILWVAGEWLRATLLGGFPWGELGYSQYRQLTVIQVAELGGAHAVSFVVCAVNAAITATVVVEYRRALLGVAVAGVLLVSTLGFGRMRLAEAEPAATVTIAGMQPSIAQPLKWDRSHTEATLRIYGDLTRKAAERKPDLIVWPETASPTILRQDPYLLQALRDLSAQSGVPLLVGTVDVTESGRQRNTAFLLTGQGIVGRYDKIHLVPFGEFVPLSGIIRFVKGWAEFISELEPGARATVFPGPPAPFGVVICYEGIFPELFRRFVRSGARVMVNMTNDAWFGHTEGPLQHLAMYPLRAVEHRTAVVRSRQHQLQLELVDRRAEAGHAVDDVLVEAVILVLGRQLEHHTEVLGLTGQLLGPGDEARDFCPLADQLLSAAVVFPERRSAHLGVERSQTGFLGRDVKDASGALPRAG